MDFEGFLKEKERNQWKIHGILVKSYDTAKQDAGQTGQWEYGDCDNRYPIYSGTKSFVSTAVGIAVEEGKFDINKSLYDYVAPLIPPSVSERQRKLSKKVTIERLLCMSVKGLPFRPEGENWLETSINALTEDVETREFNYSGAGTYLVCVALQQALKQHIMEYLRPRLFEPLHMKMPEYQDSPQGIFYGATGMMLSVRELSKFAELYYRKGIFDGKRILSKAWVENATCLHTECREGWYGFYFWKYLDGYRISGKWGQRAFVMSNEKKTITYLSDMEEGSEEATKAVEKYLIP